MWNHGLQFYIVFNNFHCTFLRNFYNSFPIVYKGYISDNNGWITAGIRNSCKRKQAYT
jgi:hypothetical protein